MNIEMYGHEAGQICMYRAFSWPDGLELHGDVEVFLRGSYPVISFSLTASDLVEGVLHINDLQCIHFFRTQDIFRVYVHNQMCTRARLIEDELVLTGLQRVWETLDTSIGDVLEMEYIKPDVIQFRHNGTNDETIREVAAEVVGEAFLKDIEGIKDINQLTDTRQKKHDTDDFEKKFYYELPVSVESKEPDNEIKQMKAELERLRSEVTFLRYKISKLGGITKSQTTDFPNDKNKSKPVNWQQEVADYLVVRNNINFTLHDEILNILCYFVGDFVPGEELYKILNRDYNASRASVDTVLQSFPYYIKEEDGWRFDAEIHHALMVALTGSQTDNAETRARVSAAIEPCTNTDFITWALKKWDFLNREEKQLVLLYITDRDIEMLKLINDDTVVRDLDNIAACLPDEVISLFTESRARIAEYFVSFGCYYFASRLYLINEIARNNATCKMAVLFSQIGQSFDIYQMGEIFKTILTPELKQYLHSCKQAMIEDLLKVGLVLGYEVDLLNLSGDVIKKISPSNVLGVFLRCAEHGEISKEELVGLQNNLPIDKVYLEAAGLYLKDGTIEVLIEELTGTLPEAVTEDQLNTDVQIHTRIHDVLLSCWDDLPVAVDSVYAISETPKMFISVVPAFSKSMSVKSLQLKKNLSAEQARAILETGKGLGLMEFKANTYNLTEKCIALQNAEEKEKWLVLFSALAELSLFQKCFKKLVTNREISLQDVVIIVDDFAPSKKRWNKLPYTWIKDVLFELDLIDLNGEVLKLKSKILTGFR